MTLPASPQAVARTTVMSPIDMAAVIDLASLTDRLRTDLRTLWRGLISPDGDYLTARDRAEAEIVLRAEAWREGGGAARVSRANALWNKTQPDEWYDDGGVVAAHVSVMLAQLIGSFPTANLLNATAFTRALLEEVMLEQPSRIELACACRQLRRTMKFVPSISEVIDALKVEKEVWSARFEALDQLSVHVEPQP